MPTLTPPYSPLTASKNEIRILDLDPNQNFDAPLHCRLRKVSLDTNPEYHALSWCWGLDHKSGVLLVDDQEFRCSPNLEKALRDIRDGKTPQSFWVDAVCINQTDIEEKSQQIMLMGQVYSQAKTVKVWLGEATDDSDEGIQVFQQLQNNPRFKQFSTSSIQSFVHLIQRPWWTRIWVVQEVLLAQTVTIHCGSVFFELDFEILGPMLREIVLEKAESITARTTDTNLPGMSPERLKLEDDLFQALTKAISSFVMAENSIKSAQAPIATLKTMLSLGPLRATDLRDKVFGCLGMLPEMAKRLQPDYTASVAKVYSVATYSLIHCFQTLHPICYHQKSINSDSPSWSLRFDREGEIHEDLPRLFRAWAAEGWDEWHLPPRFPIPDTEEVILKVQGCCLDEVVSCHPTHPDWVKYSEELSKDRGMNEHYLSCHQEWRSFFGLDPKASSEAAYVAGSSMEEAYWSTASFNVRYVDGSKELRKLGKDDVRTVIETMQHRVKSHTASAERSSSESEETSALVRDYDFGVLAATARDDYPLINGQEQYGACFFVTSRGYIGLAMHEIQPGDQVFILNRAPLPMILRRHEIDASLNVYEVMSASYVHGVMQGEAFEPQWSSEDEKQHKSRVNEFGGRPHDPDLPLKKWNDVHLR